eukprot:5631958-Prymnesium_polylepis.1
METCEISDFHRKFCGNVLILPARRKARCPIGTSRHVSPGQRCAVRVQSLCAVLGVLTWVGHAAQGETLE